MLTALVSGGSRGIGAAIVSQLQHDGIKVLAPARREMDLQSEASIAAYVAGLACEVDILVNNAGINRIALLDHIHDEDTRATLQINLVAPLTLIQAVVPGMMQRRFGRIVNISSIWSLVGKPGRISYSMSKSAVNGLTRTLAIELAAYNILVNAVAPGYVMTELTRQNNSEAELDRIRRMIPMQRLAEPAEIARVVAFLCSSNNTYLTGQVLTVDGGYSSI